MQSTSILGIINEHINFQVTLGQPNSISDDPEAVTLTGSSQDRTNKINKKEILWALLEDSLEERLDKVETLLSDNEKWERKSKRATIMRVRKDQLKEESKVLQSWSLKRTKSEMQRGKLQNLRLTLYLQPSLSQGGNDASQDEKLFVQSGGKRQHTLFQGHSGPVYAATFSSVWDFLLSSSADSTIRLWSTKHNANLVCYKGHNYLVWDVRLKSHYL